MALNHFDRFKQAWISLVLENHVSISSIIYHLAKINRLVFKVHFLYYIQHTFKFTKAVVINNCSIIYKHEQKVNIKYIQRANNN